MNQEREAVALAIFKCAFHAADVATADLIEARKRDFAPTWEHAQECADAVLALRSGGEGWRPEGGLNLSMLRHVSAARQHEWKKGGDTDAVGGLYRANELGGEVGEALNVVKKLEREARGWRGSRATVADLAAEIADVVICADLLAAEYDIDLSAAVISKFNTTSEKVGLSTRLPPSPSTQGEG